MARSLPVTTMAPVLPQELVDNIIDIRLLSDLIACRIVAHAWLPRARHLFCSVSISCATAPHSCRAPAARTRKRNGTTNRTLGSGDIGLGGHEIEHLFPHAAVFALACDIAVCTTLEYVHL